MSPVPGPARTGGTAGPITGRNDTPPGPSRTGGTHADGRGRAADDSGSLIETAAALVVMSMAALMVLTFNVTSSRVRQQAEMRAAAIALIERHSAAARQIDCVQNSKKENGGGLEVCGPAPAAATADEVKADPSANPPEKGRPATKGNKVIKPAGADESAGESGHARVHIEWADYYQLADMTGCTSDKVPPRAVREITARWNDGTSDPAGAGFEYGGEFYHQKETRLVLGPRVPLSRGWTAIGSSATVASPPLDPGRREFEYAPTGEPVQVPAYGGSGAAVRCRVLVAPPGETKGDTAVPLTKCKLDMGWNDPGTSSAKSDAGECLW